MPGSRTMPDSFVFSDASRERVKDKYRITDEEVDRTLEKIWEWEFAQPRSDWNRVCLRWFRLADERNELRRPRTYSTTAVVPTDAERESDQRKFELDIARLKVVK